MLYESDRSCIDVPVPSQESDRSCIDVPVPSQESDRSCICLLRGIEFASFYYFCIGLCSASIYTPL